MMRTPLNLWGIMKACWQVLVVASAVVLTAGTPALAQEATVPEQNDVVGPPQLQDFSLNGTVTREAPAPVQVQPRPRQAPATGDASAAATGRPSQRTRGSTAARARSEPTPRPEPSASASAPAATDLSPPAQARPVATPTGGAVEDVATLAPGPGFVSAAPDPNLGTSRNELPILPWLIAALALAGAAGWYFLRQRPRESVAGAGSIDLFEAPAPAPAPERPLPMPAPKQPREELVSTRLRPWIEIEFKPRRAVIDGEKAAIEFELSVFNSGSIPARDVLVEASLFNAGPLQDQQIRSFFENPVAEGNRIQVIPPLKKVAINTAVLLPRDQIRPIEVEGRQLFVPMIAFNALYGWSRGKGQSSVSHLIGKTTKTDKLAPFRLDLGPRVFRSLAAREHELRVRT